MSYFDPKIYNKQNLKEKDLKELEYWHEVFSNIIYDIVHDEAVENCLSSTLNQIRKELLHAFCEELRTMLGIVMQENAVGIIDSYGEDVQKIENPDTFLYEEDEEDE